MLPRISLPVLLSLLPPDLNPRVFVNLSSLLVPPLDRMSSPTPVSADQVQALFNRIAPAYDRLNDQLSGGLHQIWKRMAVKWANPQPGETCLDLCCGSGDLAFLLAEAVGPQGQVYGVDFAANLLAIAAHRAQAQDWLTPTRAKLTWQVGDALALPFADATFGAATLGYGLRNVVDIPRCLGELHRVLRSGAIVAILDMHRPYHPWSQALQTWYLNTQVVPAAQRLGLREDYAYIGPSLDRFPQGHEQVALAHQAGFRHAKHYGIAGGMMGVLVAQK